MISAAERVITVWWLISAEKWSVQKANYAVKMYENVGFKIIDENDEEYIMVCEL